MIKKLLLIPFVVLLVGCESQTCKFKEGDMVVTVLDKWRGQVHKVWHMHCAYDVRFERGEMKTFKEFELKRIEEEDF